MESQNIIGSFIVKNRRHILVDFAVFLLIFMLPAFSHLLPFPIYILEPMRSALLIGYLFSRRLENGLVLAFALPLFSLMISGHPPFFKALLISFELMANIALFSFLYEQKKVHVFIALLISVLLSKVGYYLFKFLFIQIGLLNTSLISTPLQSQFITLLGIGGFFSILYTIFYKKNVK